ncbi:plasmid mobilization protein [Listeria seeligeri]|uniref:plasmid mobilization protein n=1 Tax=Listeria seeligeri TaxID=1640 RepID=UPI0028936D4A|nr:plasmid mobilization relaxosome protein MobC [Listeria seeligeri]
MFEIACWGNPQTPCFKNQIGKEENIRMANRNRNIDLKFRVNEEEKSFIEMKMKEAGITNREAYLRKMAIDGAIVVSNYDETKKLTLELNKIGTNINQIARIANTDNKISKTDIKKVEEMMQKIWRLQRYGLSKKRLIKQ